LENITKTEVRGSVASFTAK